MTALKRYAWAKIVRSSRTTRCNTVYVFGFLIGSLEYKIL